jgi:hypothetical protein
VEFLDFLAGNYCVNKRIRVCNFFIFLEVWIFCIFRKLFINIMHTLIQSHLKFHVFRINISQDQKTF